MKKERPPKLFAKIPRDMRIYFNSIAKKRGYNYTATMIGEYLSDYLRRPDFYAIPFDDILKYESLEKDDRTFSFYYKREDELSFKRLAKGNLRSTSEQASVFLYSLYNHLTVQEGLRKHQPIVLAS